MKKFLFNVMSEFDQKLKQSSNEAVELINKYVPAEEGLQKRVIEAMNYSLLGGGKRLRPVFMMESFRMFGGEDKEIVAPFMAAIEMIHTYSLIHDDLPAMDNDDYRRGRLTNHKKFDEATAILAGDGLLNYAFEITASAMEKEENPQILKRMVKANSILSNKAGIYGMIGGQMVDLISENNPNVTKSTLSFIHECKTAALIQASLMVGAVLAGADSEEIKAMEEVGLNVGLAFQIQDDILDVIGDSEILGKSAGSDAKNEKVTFVTLDGLERAMQEQKDYTQTAVDILDGLSHKNEFLKELLLYLVTRKN